VRGGKITKNCGEEEVGDVSRFAEVIVIARDAEEIMKPLTRPDDKRKWYQVFNPIYEREFDVIAGSSNPEFPPKESTGSFMWIIQFERANWRDLLPHLESLQWPDPYSVQVLIHDEEDDCFGLWMIYDGKLVEVHLPRTVRTPFEDASVTGVLTRSDKLG
jgi:hypothetical protein